MHKTAIIPMNILYPFGKGNPEIHGVKIQVKKQIKNLLDKKKKLAENIKLIDSSKHDCLIKIQEIIEENDSMILMLEYVHIPIDEWYSGVSKEFLDNYQQRMILFSRSLADHNIITVFQKQNLGVTEKGEGKYYLDVNFTVSHGMDKVEQKKKYKEQLKNIFQYYFDKKSGKSRPNAIENIIIIQPSTESSVKKQKNSISKLLEAIENGKAKLHNQVSLINNTESWPAKLQTKKGEQPKLPPKNMKVKTPVKSQLCAKTCIQEKDFSRSSQVYVLKKKQKSFKQDRPFELFPNEAQFIKENSHPQKFSRFQEVNHKEYRDMKSSGQQYVLDFINVLESEDIYKMPHTLSQKDNTPVQPEKKKTLTFINELHRNMANSKNELSTFMQQIPLRMTQKKSTLNASNQRIYQWNSLNYDTNPNNIRACVIYSNANEIKRKVQQAIVNSLSAISKFKKGKYS